jgi:hypothetical protein
VQRHFDTMRMDEPEGWEVVDAGKTEEQVGRVDAVNLGPAQIKGR